MPTLHGQANAGPLVARRQAVQRRLATLCLPAEGRTNGRPPVVDGESAADAAKEGLAPLLGARLDQGLLEADSPAVREVLTAAYHHCLAWTLFANASIKDLLARLRAAGIPAVALKGSALIRTVMRPGERPMADIDVLIPSATWSQARRIASEAGALAFDPLERPVTAAYDYAWPVKTRDGMLVELHRYLCERPLFTPDYAGIFSRATPHDDLFLIPDHADLFLGLAIHASHHAYHLPFRAIVDGLILGTSDRLVLSTVVERAHRWHAARTTAAFLVVLRRFGFAHPDAEQALRDLAPVESIGPMLDDAPWPERETHSREWQRRLRVARLLDTATARMGYFGQRLGLRVADALWKRYGTGRTLD